MTRTGDALGLRWSLAVTSQEVMLPLPLACTPSWSQPRDTEHWELLWYPEDLYTVSHQVRLLAQPFTPWIYKFEDFVSSREASQTDRLGPGPTLAAHHVIPESQEPLSP